jgi:hypothetical protein
MTEFIMYNFDLCEYVYNQNFNESPSSIAGIATWYGLNGWEFELFWGKIFFACPYQPQGPPNPLYNGNTVSFLRIKQPEHGTDHPPHLAPRLKKE